MVHLQDTATLSFHWADYLVFAVSLAMSLGIGVFFCVHGSRKKKKASTDDYLMGGRDMNPFSVGLSMLASALNAVFLIGVPAEIHYNGIIYSLVGCAWIVVTVVTAHIFIPLFRTINTTSAHEYIGMRFNSTAAQVITALVFSGTIILFMAVVLYAPALAFAQVTGISIHVIQVVCGLVCTIYVFLGGLKAVIWTDTVQMIIIIIGTLAIAIIGTEKVGGASEVWRIVSEDNRINFNNIDSDPMVRHTVWTQVIGQIFIWLPIYAGNQMMIQRYHAVKSIRHAQIAIYTQLVAVLTVLALVVVCGLVMYSFFRVCDPYAVPGHRKVTKPDQVFPLLLMELLGEYHGLPGLYTAAVFAAALSSVSSAVNSLAAVVLEDFIKPIYKVSHGEEKIADGTQLWISRGLSLFFGLLTIALSYVAPYMGDAIIQIPMTIWGVAGAPLFGMFVLAFFFPCANAIGAITGLLVSLVFAFWLAVGGIYWGRKTPPVMPLGFNCDAPVNATNITSFAETTMTESMWTSAHMTTSLVTDPPESTLSPGLEDFYTVSYAWYGLINLANCVIIGLIVSCVVDGIKFGCKEKTARLESKLLYNYGDNCCCYCPLSVQRCFNCYANHDEEQDNQKTNGAVNRAYTPDTGSGEVMDNTV